MDYTLPWSGRLWKVSIPEDLADASELAHWTYVQTYVVSNGSHRDAMMRVLELTNPGLGFGAVKLVPIPFDGAVGSTHGDAGAVSASYKSSHVSASNNRSQKPTRPSAAQAGKDAGSDTSAPYKQSPRPATSNASRHRAPPAVGLNQEQRTKPNATPHMGGWLGSTPTNVAAR